jgi:rod shape determining protein RodA
MISEKFLQFISIQIRKLLHINYILLFLSISIFCIGVVILYSAGGGSMDPWASKQLIRFIIAIAVYLVVSLINIRFWIGISYYIYILSLLMLILVSFYGSTGMGAQRWLNLGIFNIQPSELIKFSIVLVLARYFHAEKELRLWDNIKNFIYPLLLILLPAYIIFIQPDLGSALIFVMASFTILFVIGI